MRNNNVEDMTGEWSLAEKHGMDTFLKELGFNLVQRTAVLSAGQVQVITRRAGSLHIVTRDIRGTSELVLPLDGPSVTGEGDGNLPVARRAFVDRGGEIVITETLADAPPNSEPLSVCRRSLQEDGRLCVDVQKRTKGGQMAQMRIVFSPVGSRRRRAAAAEGRVVHGGEGAAGMNRMCIVVQSILFRVKKTQCSSRREARERRGALCCAFVAPMEPTHRYPAPHINASIAWWDRASAAVCSGETGFDYTEQAAAVVSGGSNYDEARDGGGGKQPPLLLQHAEDPLPPRAARLSCGLDAISDDQQDVCD